MRHSKHNDLLAAVALATFSVEMEPTHPAVADRALRLSNRILDRHGVDGGEAAVLVLD